jgi:hypothetical protein
MQILFFLNKNQTFQILNSITPTLATGLLPQSVAIFYWSVDLGVKFFLQTSNSPCLILNRIHPPNKNLFCMPNAMASRFCWPHNKVVGVWNPLLAGHQTLNGIRSVMVAVDCAAFGRCGRGPRPDPRAPRRGAAAVSRGLRARRLRPVDRAKPLSQPPTELEACKINPAPCPRGTPGMLTKAADSRMAKKKRWMRQPI